MQIVPAGKLPLLAKKNSGKLVICNLQPTRYVRLLDHPWIVGNTSLVRPLSSFFVKHYTKKKLGGRERGERESLRTGPGNTSMTLNCTVRAMTVA